MNLQPPGQPDPCDYHIPFLPSCREQVVFHGRWLRSFRARYATNRIAPAGTPASGGQGPAGVPAAINGVLQPGHGTGTGPGDCHAPSGVFNRIRWSSPKRQGASAAGV